MVCTQKDLVKIGVDRLGDRPLWAIRVGIDFLTGRDELEKLLGLIGKRERMEENTDQHDKR